MEITSFSFAALVLMTLALYYLLPLRPQNLLLLAVSYIFYATWSRWYLLVLLVLTAANYVVALRLRSNDHPRRGVLWLALGINAGALVVLKYEDFFLPDFLNRLESWGISTGPGSLELLLPVGMSFYVVAVISYILDVYRGYMQPVRDPLHFALYMAYFPKLLVGPIERARTFLPQLATPRVVDNALLEHSFMLIAVGLVRKVVIADPLTSITPPDIFRRPDEYSALQLTVFLCVYAFALYNDFAGYTSIVRGVSGLFGIKLSSNFNIPYAARSFSEFWRRWHITLSEWLRDYIYFPTSRALLRRNFNPRHVSNVVLPPIITMLVSGVWHGTGWDMLLWGALHGGFLIGERVLALWQPAGPSHKQPRWRQTLAIGIVFGLVLLAWVPFRTGDVATAIDYWQGMLDWSNLQRPSVRVFMMLLLPIALDIVQYRDEFILLRWPPVVRATLLALAILAIFLVAQTDTGAPFVYQGF